MLAVAKKRWIPNDAIRRGPFRLRAVRIENRISAADLVKRFQDWVLRQAPAVLQHPLNLPNPDCCTCELGGIHIDLDPHHGLWSNRRKEALQAKIFGLLDDGMLKVLQSQQ